MHAPGIFAAAAAAACLLCLNSESKVAPTLLAPGWLILVCWAALRALPCHAVLTCLCLCRFYHADPHPGNLLKTPDGRLAYLDYGGCLGLLCRLLHDMADTPASGFVSVCCCWLAIDWLLASRVPSRSAFERVAGAEICVSIGAEVCV